MISKRKLLEIITGSRETANQNGREKTPHLDKVIDMLQNSPETITMNDICNEISDSVLNKNERTETLNKIMDIPILGSIVLIFY